MLGGLALGMSRREIEARIPEIVESVGLEKAIDLPIDTYSSGMGARLRFAIATIRDPEVLAGFAAQEQYAGQFKVVGNTFSEERYGIGLKKDDNELQKKINDAIAKMESDGAWKAAFEKNLGPAGIQVPSPPALDQN